MLSQLEHPAVDAALATAATLLGMEVVFIGSLTPTTFQLERVRGEMPGIQEGATSDRADSFCHWMLEGAPTTTRDASAESAYAAVAFRTETDILSYVGVPIYAADGSVFGTLCGVDRTHVEVPDSSVDVLRELAGIISLYLTDTLQTAVIRRTPAGWAVGDGVPGDLLGAMVLADLLSAELEPPPRPARPARTRADDEAEQLRETVTQLEHALAARVVVEQAIGVLTERLGYPPRECFERLRRVARRTGQRVHDLSRDVVASSCDDAIVLPDELEMPVD